MSLYGKSTLCSFVLPKKEKTMEKNMGSADRTIRVIVAAIIVALYMTKIISGTVGIILIALSAIFLLTSFVSFCPLYLPFGLNTLRKKKNV